MSPGCLRDTSRHAACQAPRSAYRLASSHHRQWRGMKTNRGAFLPRAEGEAVADTGQTQGRHTPLISERALPACWAHHDAMVSAVCRPDHRMGDSAATPSAPSSTRSSISYAPAVRGGICPAIFRPGKQSTITSDNSAAQDSGHTSSEGCGLLNGSASAKILIRVRPSWTPSR